MQLKIALCFLAFATLVNGAPLVSEYGVPHKPVETYGPPPPKPFETYGPPKEHEDIFEEYRTPLESHVPVPDVDHVPVPDVPHAIEVPEVRPVEHEVPLKPETAVPVKEVRFTDERNQYAVGYHVPGVGTEVKEEGRLITTNGGWEYVLAKTGSYKYISPEGKPVEVEWIADENGFRILSTSV